jgi:hypothetical protein
MPYIIGMRRRAKTTLLILVAAMAVVSVVTMPRGTAPSGGPLLAGAQVDPRVVAILVRSCQDCHSDSTTYPLYSYVAPISLLIRSDVSGGRAKLNLSHWNASPCCSVSPPLPNVIR